MITRDLSARIDALIARALPTVTWSYKPAIEHPRALLVMETEALFAYYLAPDGTVYECDLDRMPGYEKVENPERVAEVYAEAARQFAELATLASVDVTATPRTLAQALTYPAQVVIAQDLTDPTGRSVCAFAIGVAGARLLVRATRDASTSVDAITLHDHVWNTELASGFNLYGATGRLVSYTYASDVARVRSQGTSVDLVAPDGVATPLLRDVPSAVAQRAARELANSLDREHEHEGARRSNERDLGVMRACRQLARKATQVELGAGFALELVDEDLVLVLGQRRIVARASATSAYLDGFLPVYDVARTVLGAIG